MPKSFRMGTLLNKPIILASDSPRRAELLRQIGLEFEVMSSDGVEDRVEGGDLRGYVQNLSRQKAEGVAKKVERGIIIGADTVVVLDDQVLGKPRDEDEARRMLRRLSGRVHRVITGFCILEKPGGKGVTSCAETEVWFRKLQESEIDAYVATGEPMDKAGAYGIQGRGALFVEKLNGCFYNVVGFPLAKFWEVFQGEFLHE